MASLNLLSESVYALVSEGMSILRRFRSREWRLGEETSQFEWCRRLETSFKLQSLGALGFSRPGGLTLSILKFME